ncbi:hypothetical protein ACFOLC_12725 [Lysobacter cavernae]|uniref:Transmembrane protein n=1 Tax=Lysobacter cavernae TaxID=1685901 RepID=A0ABV7RT11_9GAMM
MNIAKIARSLVLIALVFVVVGGLVVFWWNVTDTNPSGRDIALYLGVLPAGLLGSYWLLRWGRTRAQARRETRAAAVGEPAPGTGGESIEAAMPAPDYVLHVLAGAVLLPAGASADEVAAALVEPQRPGLHPQLRDESGLPVFAAQVEGVDAGAIADALRAHLHDDGAVGQGVDEECLRALALLDPVAEELLYVALPTSAPADELLPPTTPYGNSRVVRSSAPVSLLRVRLLLPAQWPQPVREAATQWLLAKAVAMGYTADQLSIESLPVTDGAEVWRLLDHLGQALARAPDHDRQLLLAAHSHLGERSIEQLIARGRLLNSRRQEGLLPGEGAAGVLLAAIAPADADTPPLQMHRVVHGRNHAAAQSRAAVRQASELVQRALTTAAQSAETIRTVVSDADHRPSRAIEIAGAVSMVLPELDPVQHCLHLGVACGDLGPVAPLAALAVAAAQAARDAAPVLVVGLAADDTRAALAVTPLPTPTAAAEATAAAA